LIWWRNGSVSAAELILPASLPYATIEPVNVIAPIRMPRNSSTFRMLSSTAVFFAIVAAKAGELGYRSRLAGGQCGVHFEVGVDADEHRRESHQAVEAGHQFRHLRHLHPVRDEPAADAADRHHQRDRAVLADAWRADRRRHRQQHADDAVPDGPLGLLLVRQPAQREDEEYSRHHVGGRDQSVAHPYPLNCAGTWRACDG
jgi:hypothetical protein